MSEIGAAERSAAVFYYKNKLNEIKDDLVRHEQDPIIAGWKEKKIKYCEEWCEYEAKLLELGEPNGDLKSEDQVFAYVFEELRKLLGDDHYSGTWLREKINKKYKRKYELGEAFRDSNQRNRQLENLNVKETIKVLSNKQLLETLDKDDLAEVHKLGKLIKERSEFVADTKGIAIVGHDERDDDKVSTPKVTPGKSEPYYAQVDAREHAEEFAGRMKDMENLMYNDPPNAATKEEQREIANTIRNFSQFLIGMNKLLKSCTDRKHSFSMWKHAEMQVVDDTGFKHEAGKKAAIPIVDEEGEPVIDPKTGLQKVRYMTRERVSDSREKTFLWMKQMSEGMESFAVWMAYIQYRDKATDLNNRIAFRKDGLHDKLSDASIG